ncbi:hypothetical protein M0805_006443 [Coniferiporia weirii]|nr:hypothetical protein M0805_006443 [Coniferiporia weirii]
MPDAPTTPFVQPGDLLQDFLRAFWQRQVDTAEQETPDFRHPPLPLARIKKVMKSDPDVKSCSNYASAISRPAPILFCKACEIFISEITARAFIVADANKRRTLSRSDIAKALGKSDQFDFLIDIVPREDGFPNTSGKKNSAHQGAGAGAGAGTALNSNSNSGAGRDEDVEHYGHDSDVLELEEGRSALSGEVGLDELENLLNPSQPMDRMS